MLLRSIEFNQKTKQKKKPKSITGTKTAAAGLAVPDELLLVLLGRLARRMSLCSTTAGSRRARSPFAPAAPPTRKSSENLICSVSDMVRWSSNGRPAALAPPAPLPAAAAAAEESRSRSEEAREMKERTERKRCVGRRK